MSVPLVRSGVYYGVKAMFPVPKPIFLLVSSRRGAYCFHDQKRFRLIVWLSRLMSRLIVVGLGCSVKRELCDTGTGSYWIQSSRLMRARASDDAAMAVLGPWPHSIVGSWLEQQASQLTGAV